MNRDISPVAIAAIVVALLVCVGGFIFLRGALAPRPDTSHAEKAGQQMMESNRRPSGRSAGSNAYPGSFGTPRMPGQPGGTPTMPGQPGGTPTMPGQPGR